MQPKYFHIVIINIVCLLMLSIPVHASKVQAFGVSMWGSLESNSDPSLPPAYVVAPFDLLPSGTIFQSVSCGSRVYYWNGTQVYGQGANFGGSLGVGNFSFLDTRRVGPQQLTWFATEGLSVAGMACSTSTILAWTTNGTLVGWGDNSLMILDPDTINFEVFSSPTILNIPETSFIVKAVIGKQFAMALSSTGDVFCWGNTTWFECAQEGEVPLPTIIPLSSPITDIAAGNNHALVLDINGVAYGWGDNTFGQLCQDTLILFSSTPPIESPSTIVGQAFYGKSISKIQANIDGSFFITSDARLYGCGKSGAGQMGFGPNSLYVDRPREILINPNASDGYSYAVQDIFASSTAYQTLVLTKDLTLFGTGVNSGGELGFNTSIFLSSLNFINLTFIIDPVLNASVASYQSLVVVEPITRPVVQTLPPTCLIQGCACPSPYPDAICINGNWTINNLVVFGNISLNETVTFTGNVTIGPGGSISIPLGSTLHVGQCTQYYGGTIEIIANNSQLDSIVTDGLLVLLVESNCTTGNPNVILTVTDDNNCISYRISNTQNSETGLFVSISSLYTCSKGSNWKIILGATLGAVVGLIIIVLIIVFAIPKVRLLVFPFYKRSLIQKEAGVEQTGYQSTGEPKVSRSSSSDLDEEDVAV